MFSVVWSIEAFPATVVTASSSSRGSSAASMIAIASSVPVSTSRMSFVNAAVLALEHLEAPDLALGVHRAAVSVLGVCVRELARLRPGLEVVLGGPARVDEVPVAVKRLQELECLEPGRRRHLAGALREPLLELGLLSSATVTALMTTNDIPHLRFGRRPQPRGVQRQRRGGAREPAEAPRGREARQALARGAPTR